MRFWDIAKIDVQKVTTPALLQRLISGFFGKYDPSLLTYNRAM